MGSADLDATHVCPAVQGDDCECRVYLWLWHDLTDPNDCPTPLASYCLGRPESTFTWAPGVDITQLPPALQAFVAPLATLVALGVRFDQDGMGVGSIQEREPFETSPQPELPLPDPRNSAGPGADDGRLDRRQKQEEYPFPRREPDNDSDVQP